MNRYEKALELDKVLEMLAAETGWEEPAAFARTLEPSNHLAEVQRLLDETGAAYMLTARFGSPSFGQAKNVTNSLRRAAAGASLSLRELLDKYRPQYLVHGHVHLCYDNTLKRVRDYNGTTLINAYERYTLEV